MPSRLLDIVSSRFPYPKLAAAPEIAATAAEEKLQPAPLKKKKTTEKGLFNPYRIAPYRFSSDLNHLKKDPMAVFKPFEVRNGPFRSPISPETQKCKMNEPFLILSKPRSIQKPIKPKPRTRSWFITPPHPPPLHQAYN